MPLTRYQIRNEYGLADPELYRAADRDDPEALLEGVAMAGLVGVLRQLGDLAEFAAEIFHNLHEEVMATAARGHGLMVRVQQLEAEFPSIEKAFLSRTNHSPFFLNSGVDWHPNLHMEQNLITRGDLPRFVMDSYEECRGPPRLFLLDKFDVAGAGACLKRYTDPSFFKIEAASFEIANVEVQREKKIRKVKKKGSRWRNGETPEVVPTSHAKLHQLFLEERVENGHSDPARLVKLKRRQLNGSGFDPKPAKSYMKKFLETPSPERKAVCEDSVTPLALKLTSDNSSESGLEIHEISIVSPVKKSSQQKESTFSSPNAQEVSLNPFTDELNGDAIDRGILTVHDPIAEGETDESPTVHKMAIQEELAIGDGETEESPTVHKMALEEQLAVDENGKTEGSLDGEHSDDMASEMDNYMDALTTMESEMETDSEYKPKNDQVFWNVGKHGIDSDANEEHLDVHANFSDSQSIGNSSVSGDGNSSFKKARSNSSYSDSLRNLADNTASDGEGAAKVFPSAENCVAEIVNLAYDRPLVDVETLGTVVQESEALKETNTVEGKATNPEESSSSSCLPDSNAALPVANSLAVSLEVPGSDETQYGSIELGFESPITDKNGTDLPDSSVAISDVPYQMGHDILFPAPLESHSVDALGHENPNLFLNVSVQTSNAVKIAPKKKGSDNCVNEEHQGDYADDVCAENLVEGIIGSPHSIVPPTEEQLSCIALPEVEADLGVIVSSDYPDVVNPDGVVSVVDTATAETGVEFSQVQLIELGGPYSEEEVKLKEISGTVDVEEMGGFTGEGDTGGLDADLFDHQSHNSDKPDLNDRVNYDNVVNETVQAEDVAASATAIGGGANDDIKDVIHPPLDLICSPSHLIGMQEALSATEDPHHTGLELNEATSPECHQQSVALKERVTPSDLDSSPCRSVSDESSNREVIEQILDPSLADQTESSQYVSDGITASSSELSYLELELKPTYRSHSVEISEDAVCSPACHLPEARTSSELPMQLQADQISAKCVHAATEEANSESWNLHISPTCDLETGNPSELPLELQSDQLEGKCLQSDEASVESANRQSEQIKILSHMDQENCLVASSKSCLEDLPSQELLLQSTGQELNSGKLARNPFDSVLPSFSLFHEATHVNLEEMPPLPPLPPVQWRIGKIQPTPLPSKTEWIDHTRDTFPPIQPSTTDEQIQFGFASSDREIVQSPNPFLSHIVCESQRLQQSSTELVANYLQPTPLLLDLPTVNDASSRQDCLPLEEKQSLNQYLTSPETPNERSEHDVLASRGESIQPSSSLNSPEPGAEHSTSEHDPVPFQGLPIWPSNQLALQTGLETKASGYSSLNSQKEHGNSPEESVVPLTVVEEKPQHDLVASQGETAWPSTMFALPPTFEVGKPNGSKLPRPRNPLIDAVAAHDKSRLRKVTERARPKIGPKVDERDSLLEQIRTKSFNLKPATMTRPGIHGIQGPKTNLKVAAILEKASAIRQALAGSDEDDDSDSWSDS